jgi:hypothetical protein
VPPVDHLTPHHGNVRSGAAEGNKPQPEEERGYLTQAAI